MLGGLRDVGCSTIPQKKSDALGIRMMSLSVKYLGGQQGRHLIKITIPRETSDVVRRAGRSGGVWTWRPRKRGAT